MAGYRKKNKENFFIKIIRYFLLIVLFPIVLIYLVVEKIKKIKVQRDNKNKIRLYNISQLDHLSGIEFENYLKSLFENMGYETQMTKATGDYGADLIVSKNGKKTIIQAKCYNHTVGVKAVQEIIAARNHYHIYRAMVITNNYFSREAENLALESDVILTDRIVLEKMLKKFDVRIEKNSTRWSSLTKEARSEMLAKYKYWI